MTADAAIHSIREVDSDGTIGLISSEEYPPYARPPLSKGLWTGDEGIEDVDLETSNMNLEMHLNQSVIKIDTDNKKVYDKNKNEYTYQKLLIATGGTPKKLPNIEEEGIIYYRTISDYKKLRDIVDKNENFGIIGGGFIGSEIAAGIKMYKPDAEVTMIFPESGIGALIFPKVLSDFITDYFRQNDVNVLTGESVESIIKEDKTYLVEAQSGKKFKFDTVIAGLGITPNIKLAKEANLEVDDGIIVNKYLQTNDLDIYAAGDVAIYHIPVLNKFIRIEHEDNALMMGEIAGKNMAGKEIPFDHLSMFYSDFFEYGYEAVGILDPKLEIVEDLDESLEEGIIYYLEKGRVKGVLLWNVWDKVDEARGLIAEYGPFSSKDLKGRINILTIH